MIKGRVIGILTADKVEAHFYDEQDAEIASTFANQAAIAIENARLFEAEKRRVAQLKTISEIGKDIASILDLDELLHRVVSLLVSVFGYHYANILMVDEEAQEIVLTASAGQTGRVFEGYRLKIGEQGITGWVAGSGKPLLVNDVRQAAAGQRCGPGTPLSPRRRIDQYQIRTGSPHQVERKSRRRDGCAEQPVERL
jgi:sigma-B regulation protein RsbU (phosphoserine phosphatase)